MLNKTKIGILIAFVLIIIAGVVVMSCTKKQKDREGTPVSDQTTAVEHKLSESLGDYEIVVYVKGRKILLDTNSPHYKELQLACEDFLELESIRFLTKIADSYFDVNHPLIEEIRSKEFAIELIYREIQKINPEGRYTPVLFSRLLIPLTGRFSAEAYNGRVYTRLFPLLTSEEIDEHYRHNGRMVVHPFCIGTTKDVGRIRDILQKYGVKAE